MRTVVKEFQPEYDIDQPVWVRDEKQDWSKSKMVKLESEIRTRYDPMLESKWRLRGGRQDHTHGNSRSHRTMKWEEHGG